MNKKNIILIGGTAGSGKTSISRELKTDHRLGTGFIREIVKNFFNNETQPELFSYTFSGDNPVKTLKTQAEILKSHIISCIKRARKEGTSLVIEGNHLLPSLYCDEDIDYFIILDYDEFNSKRLCEGTHMNRELSEKDYEGIRIIKEFILDDAVKNNVVVIDSNNCFEEVLLSVRGVIGDN